MQIVQAELEGDRLALLADRPRRSRPSPSATTSSMRAGWMRPSAISRSMACLRDLAAVRIEAREDDRARRVVDDEVDAGGELERADVAPLAADDAPLQVVARQVDDRHGGLDRVLGGAALDGLGDVLLGAVGGRLARLGVEALEQVGGVVPRVGLDVLERAGPWLRRRSGRRRARARAAAAATSCSYRRRGARRPAARARRASASRAVQLLLEPLGADLPLGERASRARRASVRAPAPAAAPARACRSASVQRCRAPSPWPRAALPSCGSRRRARRPCRMRSACSSARPMVSAAMRLRLATQTANTAAAATTVTTTLIR